MGSVHVPQARRDRCHHLPQRGTVASKLARALRPGGWLVIEDYDLHTIAISDRPHRAWATVNHALVEEISNRYKRLAGFDPDALNSRPTLSVGQHRADGR